MAVSAPTFESLCVGLLCLIVVGHISAQVINQFPGNTKNDRQDSSYYFYQQPEYPRDCSEFRDSCSSVSSGVYLIKPDGYEEPFDAYCDNETDTESWTTILRRFDGSVNFDRNWNDYKYGFGFLHTEFWIGHDKLSFLTNQAVYEIRIDVTLENGASCDVRYDAFRISDEGSDYKISKIGTYESDIACRWSEGTTFTDCNDVYGAGLKEDGVYFIRPEGWDEPFEVFCNMSIDGGNWTVIQRRVDGSIDFYRNWTEYREGFGNIQHEFWLGNEKLHHITKQATYEYRFDYVYSSTSYYNKYTNFEVGSEANKYRLANVGTRTGNRGYSLRGIQNTPFSTHDQDNDGRSYDCAEGHRSGWWHGASFYTCASSYNYCVCFVSGRTHLECSYANPNGDYNGGQGQSMFDTYYDDCHYTYAEMKIRRIS